MPIIVIVNLNFCAIFPIPNLYLSCQESVPSRVYEASINSLLALPSLRFDQTPPSLKADFSDASTSEKVSFYFSSDIIVTCSPSS